MAALAAVLVMCGPGSADENSGVVGFPGESPSSAPSSALATPVGGAPEAVSVPGGSTPTTAPLAASALPEASPAPGATPSPEEAQAPGGRTAGEGDPTGSDHAAAPRSTPSRTARPGPSRRPAGGGAAGQGAAPAAPAPAPNKAPSPPATGPTVPGIGSLCEQAERLGRWPAGSDQARLCHGLYG
ncbi:hypothetical protein ACF9IK_32995 [Kitasatospora hibisci]|uniref:hypothetical protein n=1 Tax=Kitasatospora hibisci TaxID=3369522 RepID=UPI00375512C8